ncbi:hypothetical protein PVAND_011603 [Polypedilum vanderplanki]|uniref:Arf-GAP domain-containing protein n=1 Tax=Polypedilum vanderplanki TaxID=319348 RepID=A0A9J6CKX3_POLVA|nr:hypothetical protein PVAND_011603 [Polypedilum vanderplanki]
MDCPPKADIDAIFNRLRSLPYNKVCFDCNAKNPTWSSITYGVFICLDCSSVHRSLGVHLTFVRSTQLDTNWNWQQIRQMQVGGNANASSFFRQHNCVTTDAQQKYNSRAAQLYKDKLITLAQQACKRHGTTLHINELHYHHEETTEKESDFFENYDNENVTQNTNNNINMNVENNEMNKSTAKKPVSVSSNLTESNDNAEPSVNFLDSVETTTPPKSSIGVRKIQPKKSGIGAKKGLGAKKVQNSNFADIEQRATLADQLKEPVIDKKLTQEEEAEAISSVRLAYQDLSLKKSKEEERLKNLDPNKAKQMERLGMAFNVRGGVSHSILTDMQTINQDQAPVNMKSSSSKNFDRDNSSSNDMFDDYLYSPNSNSSNNKQDFQDAMMMGFEPIELKQNVYTMFSPTEKETSSKNFMQTSVDKQPSSSSKTNRNVKSDTAKSSSSNFDSDSIQKKFAGAKGISSDQFFGNDASHEKFSNLSKFQGSTAISSADYFGDGQESIKKTSRLEFHSPDLDLEDVKDSIKTGVTRVAGRLSTLANNVNNFIQDKYGH